MDNEYIFSNPFLKPTDGSQSLNIFGVTSQSPSTSDTPPISSQIFQPSKLFPTSTTTAPRIVPQSSGSITDVSVTKPNPDVFGTFTKKDSDLSFVSVQTPVNIFGGGETSKKDIVKSSNVLHHSTPSNPWCSSSIFSSSFKSSISSSIPLCAPSTSVKGIYSCETPSTSPVFSICSKPISSVGFSSTAAQVFSQDVQSKISTDSSNVFGGPARTVEFGLMARNPNFTEVSQPFTTSSFSTLTRKSAGVTGEKSATSSSNYPWLFGSKPKIDVGDWYKSVNEEEIFPLQPKTLVSFSHDSKNKEILRSSSDKVSVKRDSSKPVSITPSIIDSTTLIAVDIPEKYLDESVLKTHFSKYGVVSKITVNRKTRQASVFFTDHQSASEAKRKGKKLHPLVPEMRLFFATRTDIPKQKSKNSSRSEQKSTTVTSPPPLSKSQSPIPKVFASSPVKSPPSSVSQKKSSPESLQKSEIDSKAPSENLRAMKDVSSLLKSQATNNYDKYLILDARDKNIRSITKREVDLKKAKYLLATCPDMCPEKERYSRDIQYDVSSFETTDGKLDHKLCIKKFSRSSADKDEPLPHELRPGPVLKMSMDFLTCNMMPKGDSKETHIDLWYNYLCNRTRGLRNDIIQQHLTDPCAVYVLERCMRFHIHCSHSLCEEPLDNFDSKMNTEHLSKSLQSLKELYQDLGEKGIYFKTESEFRAYEILLSVNDGNVILKYLTFRESVQKSKEVQFAIKVLTSIHTNNYVKFFKLVKEATYLQACIMHRFFDVIRMRALLTLVRCYSQQVLSTSFFMDILGFTNGKQVESYIKFFGLAVNDGVKVLIDKTSFEPKPSSLPPLSRSYIVLERRMNIPLANVIENGDLPENPLLYYKPHDSFDRIGYLKEESIEALDQKTSSTKESGEYYQENSADFNIECRSKEEKDSYLNSKLELELQYRVDTYVKINLLNRYFICWKKYVTQRTQRKSFIAQKYALIWRSYCERKKEIESGVINDYIASKYFRKWNEFIDFQRYIRSCILEAREIEASILEKKFYYLWRRNYLSVKSRRISEFYRKYLLSLKYFKFWRFRTSEIILERRSEVFYREKLQSKSFKKWKTLAILRKNKRIKLNFESFPCVGLEFSPQEQNDRLQWGYDRDDDKENLLSLQIADIDNQCLHSAEKHFYIQEISRLVSLSPLPLVRRFGDHLRISKAGRPPTTNIFERFIKIQLLIDYGVDLDTLEWVRRKFNMKGSLDVGGPVDCIVKFTGIGDTYAIVVKENDINDTPSSNFNDATVIFLVGNSINADGLRTYASSLGNIPYLILMGDSKGDISDRNIWSLSRDSRYDPETTEKLMDFMLEIWQGRGDKGNLHLCTFSISVGNFISKFVLSPVCEEISRRKEFDESPIPPILIVRLYNASIGHLKKCMEGSNYSSFNIVPAEVLQMLDINFRDNFLTHHNDEVMEIINYLFLPNLSSNPQDFVDDDLRAYANKVAGGKWGASITSEIDGMIAYSRRTEAQFDYYSVSWIDVLLCCIRFKLSHIPQVKIFCHLTDLYNFNCRVYWSEMRLSRMEKPSVIEEPEKSQFSVFNQPGKKSKTRAMPSILLPVIEAEKDKAEECEKWLESLTVLDEDLKQLCENHGIVL